MSEHIESFIKELDFCIENYDKFIFLESFDDIHLIGGETSRHDSRVVFGSDSFYSFKECDRPMFISLNAWSKFTSSQKDYFCDIVLPKNHRLIGSELISYH